MSGSMVRSAPGIVRIPRPEVSAATQPHAALATGCLDVSTTLMSVSMFQ